MFKGSSKYVVLAFVFAFTAMIFSGTVYAEFPDKTITLIVPWSPGGSGDMTCLILAAEMENQLGKCNQRSKNQPKTSKKNQHV